MAEPKVVHATGQVRRVFKRSAETLFAMLSDQEKLRSWYGVGDHHDLVEFNIDFAVGGEQKVAYRFHEGPSPVAGMTLTNVGRYLNIVPNQRVVTSSMMAMNGRTFSSSLVTYELVPADGGTELLITHQNAFFENADGPEMRQAGWVSLLNQIEKVLNATEPALHG